MSTRSTVIFKGIEIEFSYNYQPAESQTYDYPGCDEEFEIFDATINGVDASDILDCQLDEFEECCIDYIKD